VLEDLQGDGPSSEVRPDETNAAPLGGAPSLPSLPPESVLPQRLKCRPEFWQALYGLSDQDKTKLEGSMRRNLYVLSRGTGRRKAQHKRMGKVGPGQAEGAEMVRR
jgi:hypothetical protein